MHAEEHIPGGDAIDREYFRLVIGDQFPGGERLGSQRVFVGGGWCPSNIGWAKERYARCPKQSGQVTGAGVVSDDHGRVLDGREGRVQSGLTDDLSVKNVIGHAAEAVVLFGRSQKCDGMTHGLEFLSELNEP